MSLLAPAPETPPPYAVGGVVPVVSPRYRLDAARGLSHLRDTLIMDEKQAQKQAQKQALQVNLDTPPGSLKQTGWKQYTRHPKVLAGAGAGALLVLGVGISLFSSSPQSEVYEASPEAQLDKSGIVAGAQDSHSNTIFQSTQQLEDFEQQLLSQEAQRYLLEAQRQVTEPTEP